ncbi:hypothetical protein JCGZ_10859 [Jatropha curcas]|uniref:Uncharacterized protein n=1 Tax=Jatropha curcas TaxID=180498 RepID=A0A067KGU9_JATCU|nr:hypothetical protein JCGZ_10859 [Jatropha curcas]
MRTGIRFHHMNSTGLDTIGTFGIPVTEEVPVVPPLDIDPASLILPVFSFSAYEILSYDFRANIEPLQPFVDRALSMDYSLYWLPLVCFYILSQYLLLNGIDGYGSLWVVPIVEQMATRCMPFPLILAETFMAGRACSRL